MKKIIVATFLFLANTIYAIEGVVIVLETPLFADEQIDAPIVQYVRQGDKIFIHDQHINKNYYADGQLKEDPSLFYTTLDRKGHTAFVQKAHVKLIYKDLREMQSSARPFKFDPTDYRLPEPLPPNFPLEQKEKHSASIAIGLAPAPKVNYPYTTAISSDSFSSQITASATYSHQVPFDKTNRVYFGGMINISSFQNEFELIYKTEAREKHLRFSLGPYISYLAHRTEKFNLHFFGHLGLGLHTCSVEQLHPTSDFHFVRRYNSFYLGAKAGSIFSYKILPQTHLMLKMEMEGNLPYSLTSSDPTQGSDFMWASEDQIDYPLKGNYSISLGIVAYH